MPFRKTGEASAAGHGAPGGDQDGGASGHWALWASGRHLASVEHGVCTAQAQGSFCPSEFIFPSAQPGH